MITDIKLETTHPKLVRGRVWCTRCGRTEKVDAGECLSTGWPKCCGETMTIDSPEERAAPVTPTDAGKSDEA